MSDRPRQRAYWRHTLLLTALLLTAWFIVAFVAAYHARELASIHFFRWPLSFYVAAQGALIVFVCIIWVYARRMRALDRRFLGREDRGE